MKPYHKAGAWGFTQDANLLQAVYDFIDGAVADGWSIKPTYPNSEPVNRSATLEREGYKMLAVSRDNSLKDVGKWKFEAHISIWCPKGIAIEVPPYYNWEAIVANTRKCSRCQKTDVDTFVVGFANRSCADCLPAEKKRLEYPGWCN